MKLPKIFPLLTIFALSFSCHSSEQDSGLNIIRGRPLAKNGPAADNVVGLSDDGKFIFCTGSIVAEDMIVTAAHCVRDKAKTKVVFGQPNSLVDVIDTASIETYKPYQEAAFPNFDIAWLKLDRKIPAGFKPMEILRDPSSLPQATDFQIAGYGIEKTNCQTANCTGKLLEADTTLQSYHDSPRLMSLLVFKGAASLGFGASCNGDSGGPAYAKIADRWYLIGVTNGATGYLNPDSFVNPALSCEEGSDTYTFMGDYTSWLEKRSTRDLVQTAALNPDRAEPAFLIKGEQKPTGFVEPTTWAEWLRYPYHNTQAWNTVNDMLLALVQYRGWELPSGDLIKIFEDAEFSQSQAELMTALRYVSNDTKRQRFLDQSLDLRPLTSWSHLETLTLADDAAGSFAQMGKFPSLKSLILVPSNKIRDKSLDLNALQTIGSDLRSLDLRNYSAAEMRTLPAAALPQITALALSVRAGDEKLSIDLSAAKNLKSLTVGDWDNSSKLLLPDDLVLNNLTIQHRHRSDLHWIDMTRVKSIQTLNIRPEVLSSSEVLNIFQSKGIEDLTVPDNGLTAKEFPLQAFTKVQTAKLDGNQFADSKFLANLPALSKVDLRSNPLNSADCPANVSCRFDRVLNPRTLVDFCINTVPLAGEISDDTYSYAYTVRRLFSSQNLQSNIYTDANCSYLDQMLTGAESLELEGDMLSYILKKENLDATLLRTFKHLKKLTINLSDVVHSSSLGELSALETISLLNVQFNSTDFFQKLPALKKIDYSSIPLTSLEALSNPHVEEVLAYNFGDMLYFDGGKLETIGEHADFPSLRTLYLYGNPLKDIKGIDRMTSLVTLNLSNTHGLDLSPLATLVGTSVFLGDGYSLESCPVLHGTCFFEDSYANGSVFGSDAENSNTSTWYSGQSIPGLGKTIQN